MARRRFNLSEAWETVVPFFAPTLLGVFVFLSSTFGFVFFYRNDLLILAAGQQKPRLARILVTLGANAQSATETFPEPALIDYLHSIADREKQTVETAEMARLLIEAGASVTERSESGWPPIMLAAATGQFPIVEVLVANGAEIDARALGGEQTEGMTALMAAAMHGYADIVRFLIEKGGNLHLRSVSGFTPLLLASSGGHLTTVEILLDKGASVPLSTIQVAERNGHEAVAKRLELGLQQRHGEALNRRPARFPEE